MVLSCILNIWGVDIYCRYYSHLVVCLTVFNRQVMRMTGDPMRAYGMDTGRHTEGRRNFVASRCDVLFYVSG